MGKRLLFAENRTEELGFDLWGQFVIPPFIDKIDLLKARKPRVITGGRGSGKTMLIRYLSHKTQFSPKRRILPQDATEGVGLYWRVDSQFSDVMFERGLELYEWQNAFEHYATMVILNEIAQSLKSILQSNIDRETKDQVRRLNFGALSLYFPGEDLGTLESLELALQNRRRELGVWLKNLNRTNMPLCIPKEAILSLLDLLKQSVNALRNTTYYIFIDEYESLREYQQIVINTWLKYSEGSLIYSLAVKKGGLKTGETLSGESISEIHDYRLHDIEAYLNEEEYPTFAAEVLILNLSKHGRQPENFDPEILGNYERIGFRKDPLYRRTVQGYIERIFPGLSNEELSKRTLEAQSIRDHLQKGIQKSLREKHYKEEFEWQNESINPRISIIIPYLLQRPSTDVGLIEAEVSKSKRGEKNKFEGPGGWVDNIFLDCLLDIYEPYLRACPVYSGFQVLLKLSHSNLRHFLELAYKSLAHSMRSNDELPEVVDPITQAEGIVLASRALLNEIKTFGSKGGRLYSFALRLGSLFSVNRKNPSKSRTEVIQFSVVGGYSRRMDEIQQLLMEAVKHSVLIEQKISQRYNRDRPEAVKFTLNPIYAPYFLISYRQRKKMELTSDDLEILFWGNETQYEEMVRRMFAFEEDFGASDQMGLFLS